MSEPILNVTIGDGKYTVVMEEGGKLHALRCGEPWRDCIGDGLIYCLAAELEAARNEITVMKESRAVLVEQEQKSRDEANKLRAKFTGESPLRTALDFLLRDYKAMFIDWAKFSKNSPDYDENYKPKFPPFVADIEAMLQLEITNHSPAKSSQPPVTSGLD